MLKAEINDKFTKLEIVGDLTEICTDLSHILCAVNEKLSEKNPALGHSFRCIFTAGFMDGICFNDDREHMEHYLAEGRADREKDNKVKDDIAEALEGLVSLLKSKRDMLEKVNKELKKRIDEQENGDEAK